MAHTISLFKVPLTNEASSLFSDVLKSGQLTSGPYIEKFEKGFAELIGNPHTLAVSDASGGLVLALYLSGVRPGSEVIVSPLTCSSTTMPIANLFATPVWCDADPTTGMISPDSVERSITDKTKAILVYHWGGDVTDLDPLREIAKKHQIALIDDASNALGARYKGSQLGANGCDFTVFSFRPTKLLTTIEGGALACRSADQVRLAKRLRRYGIDDATFRDRETGEIRSEHPIDVPGFNFPLTNFASALGIGQLSHIPQLLEKHRGNARYLETQLTEIQGITLLKRPSFCESSFWTYTLLAERRDALQKKLTKHGVQSQRLHMRQDIYRCFGSQKRSLPGVDAFFNRTLSIPCGFWLSQNDLDQICEVIQGGW